MNKEDGYITKSEYVCRMQWNDDVLTVTDSIKSEMMGKMEEMILDHFDMDMSDLREYMSDKIKWEQKQSLVLQNLINDAEPVVHCAECRYLGFKDFSGVCKIDGLFGIVRPGDYCSRGERKDEQG